MKSTAPLFSSQHTVKWFGGFCRISIESVKETRGAKHNCLDTGVHLGSVCEFL